MLTLNERELKDYTERFGARATYEIQIVGCGVAACDWKQWRPEPRHPFHEDDTFAAVFFSGPSSGKSYDARWNGQSWELTLRYGFMARSAPTPDPATAQDEELVAAR